ncbi:chromate transporter [Hydrogenophaga sp.]|uniref:chromate transporter n=1 Tax=Hydrogenophaga sp. TaxID=1904254 RepID=UPI002726B3C9|nr:chromate transporter [Hydrogenophaga sp.]MDO9437814.1 chromate transporter [Hydrogenophaga sp.]
MPLTPAPIEPAPPPPLEPGAAPRIGPRSRTDLFLACNWMALQGFGGMLAVMQRELVEKRRWMTRDEFIEDWAVAQIMPGPNVLNLAMMVGGRHFGVTGALAALAGMLSTPMVVVLVLGMLYGSLVNHPIAQNAVRGMVAVAAGLTTATGIKLVAALERNAMGKTVCAGLMLATFAAIAILRLPLLWVLLLLGGAACVWAYNRLSNVHKAKPQPRQTP